MTADLWAPWRDRAACKKDPARFDHSVDGETTAARRMRVIGAAIVCLRCPVATDCLADVDLKTDQGVRGGMMIVEGRGGVRLEPIEKWLATAAPPQPSTKKVKRGTREFPREHGTMRGYRQHSERKDMPFCDACRAAKSAKNRAANPKRRRRAVS